MPLGLFTRGSLAQYAEPEVMFGTVQAGLAFYEPAFGVPYPYGKYDQIFVPEYNWGAMENVGAVTFNESTCSAPGSPTRGASSARSSCCTSSATCGSATR